MARTLILTVPVRSTRCIFLGEGKFPDLESKLWRGVMWSPSYYVGTAGHVSAETIERYIRDQQTEWKRGSSTG